METPFLLLGGVLLAAAVVLFVLLPIVRGRHAPLARTEEDVSESEYRRAVALRALRDLEYDRVTGKLDEEDYRRLKQELAREALAALEANEGPETPDDLPPSDERTEADEAVEEEIARIRRGLRDGRTCRVCAHVNPPGSKFCGHCGGPLEREDTEPVAAGTDR